MGVSLSLIMFCFGCGSGLIQSVPTPSITQILPQSIPAGSKPVTMQITGSNFTNQAVVLWNGDALATSVVNSSTLAVTIGSNSLAKPSTAQVQVQDTGTKQSSQVIPVTIAAPATQPPTSPLAISGASLPQAVTGTPYAGALTAAGGSPAYTWSLSAGTLPPGLRLAAGGIISGTPTASGNYSFGVSATDSSSPVQTAAANMTLSVTSASTPLSITSPGLPSATSGTVYSGALQASGGNAPYMWTISAGSLPAGLGLGSDGIVAGTPAAAGNANFTVTVTDSGSPAQSKSAAMSLAVSAPMLTIGAATLSAGIAGSSYQGAMQANGGTAPYSWTVSAGSLPAGLSLSPGGVISGTPAISGTGTFTATVTDLSSPVQSKSASMTLAVAPSSLTITSSSLAAGTVGAVYSGSLQASGGTAPYTWKFSGTLPAGLSLSAGGVVTGTPTTAGPGNFTAAVTDSGTPAQSAMATISFAVSPSSLTISSTSLAAGTVGAVYSGSLQAGGGTAPYMWSISSGSLPAGLTLSAGGNVSGTPTALGTGSFTALVTDSGKPAQSATASISFAVSPSSLTITSSSLAAGTVGSAYSGSLQASGGTAPYTWKSSGTLPAGLSLSAGGVVTGTPTAAGPGNFTATVADSGSPAQSKSVPITLTIAPSSLTITSSSLAAGTVGSAYSGSLQASGGTGTYTWKSSGTLPAGLGLSAGGVVTGTPTAAGPGNFTAMVTDSGTPAQSATATISFAVSPSSLTIASTSLAAGTVGSAYSGSLQASGGTAPYTWKSSGSLPAGLSLSAGGVVTGTPTAAGPGNFTATVADSGAPAQSKSASVSLTVAGASLTITSSSLAAGTAGAAYSGSLQAAGGTGPYTWSISSGSLPAGLTLSAGGIVSGTPARAGSANFTATVADVGSPAQSRSATVTLAIAPSSLTITSSSLAAGTAGAAYSGSLQAGGGTAPYTWSISSGNLPAGLSLTTNGVVAGTPTAAGTGNFTALVSDSGSPAQSRSASVTLAVAPSSLTITSSSLAGGTAGAAYSGSLQASGGTGPYTWTINSGSLPAGLSLTTNGVVTGTPTVAGLAIFTVTAADASTPAQSRSATVSLAVAPSSLTISSTSLAAGTVGAVYSGSLQAGGGTGPYTWSISSGSLPAGLTLSAGGNVSGTPTALGTGSFTALVTDSGKPAQSATASISFAVSPSSLTITSSNLAAGTVGAVYSGSLQASGGTGTYTWKSSGTLPAGLSLSAGGVVTGTPTAAGPGNFTATVADSGSPAQSKSASVTLTVAPSSLTITSLSLASGTANSAYTSALQLSGGTAPYTWSVSPGSLPGGLTLGAATGVISGTPTSSGKFPVGVTVRDSSSSAQTATAALTLTVLTAAAPLAITSTTLPAAALNQSYSAALTATGGNAPYSWAISAGSLPQGLNLDAATGMISGTASTKGSANFTATVSDSGSPAQAKSAALSLSIAPVTLTITTSTLSNGTDGTAYSSSMTAGGGTPAYTWSISAGTLPAGLTLAATTGVISGTPTASGTSNFTATVSDNGSPVQKQSASGSIAIGAAQAATGPGKTWYVRPDGGTRYSSNQTAGQCDGTADVSYASTGGTGVNQHCAFNDVRYLWTDGSYTNDPNAGSPKWGWIGSGGDTYIVRGSIADGVSWRVGQSGPNVNDYFGGLAGNPYGSGAPPPLSGISAQHTRILGGNYASCHSASAKTQLHGGYGASWVLQMAGVSYVDVACMDITDFSSCGRSGQINSCNVGFPISDYATTGISWNNSSTNDTLTDVHIHGMASTGMIGPTGTGMVFSYLDILGNPSSGWDADGGDGTTGTGTLLVQHFNISWNGCSEEYPIIDALPYNDCTDDSSNGYGDGFGTATVPSSPGWQATFDQGIASYNTQDGLDALHLIGRGSSMTITRTLAYGNMGQQIKVGGASGTAANNVIVTNCNALRQAIPGTPSGYNSRLGDFCRAADTGIALTVGVGTSLKFDDNTIYSASATGIEVDCDHTYGACDSTSLIDFRNNIFLGFRNSVANGYVGQTPTNDYSNPVYGTFSPNPFTNPGSIYSNNITYHVKSSWACPTGGEINALCVDPLLTDESWHLYGYGDASPLTSSPLLGGGLGISGMTTDFPGQSRGNPPTIGAYEK